MNYPIPLYLNQKYVFDILAMLEDGFSQINTLKTVDSTSNEIGGKVKGQIGLSNAFAFLGVKLGGEINDQSKETLQSESERQKVHTPNSLFAKMQLLLNEKQLIRRNNILESHTGEFILFKSTLRKNPIIDNLEGYLSLFKLALSFSDNSQQSKQQKIQDQTNKKLVEQFETLIHQMKTEGSLDLIGENIGDEDFKAVLTIDRDYLNDPSLSDIADGEFFVLGKTIKVLNDGSPEGINLLRKTSLSRISDETLKGMFSGFQAMDQHGLKNAEFVTEIKAPVLQVIPVAIYA